MAYSVQLMVPSRPLGKSDVEFIVSTPDNGVLGTLKVSKGALVWFPKKTTYGYKVTWKKFHKIATESFTQEEAR